MSCLYRTSLTYTFEEDRKFFLTLTRPRYIAWSLTLLLIFIIAGLYFCRVPIFVALAAAEGLILRLVDIGRRKKSYYSAKALVDDEEEYEFYDSYLIKKSRVGTRRAEYDDLYRVIETKTNFYLMLGKDIGFVLLKANFPQGLEDFLRSLKAQKRA